MTLNVQDRDFFANKPDYRFGGDVAKTFFFPLFALDRRFRLERWPESAAVSLEGSYRVIGPRTELARSKRVWLGSPRRIRTWNRVVNS